MHSGIGQITGAHFWGGRCREQLLGRRSEPLQATSTPAIGIWGSAVSFVVGPPAQIDFYALSGLEMVTDGENSH